MASASPIKTDDSIRVVLIGKTGEGKSTTANKLLSENKFTTSAFAKSVTKSCQRGTCVFDGKRKCTLVDTPGLFDLETPVQENINEIVRCIALSAPGPHAILLVTSVGRFTKQDRDVFKKFSDIFGKPLFKFLIVVFTRLDNLKRDGNTMSEFIESLSSEEKQFLKSCDDRYIGIDNKTDDYNDAESLMNKISELTDKNENTYYTHAMYKDAENTLQERMDDLKRESTRRKDDLREEVLDECEKNVGFFTSLLVKIKNIFKKLFGI